MPESQLPKVEIQQFGLRTHIATTESDICRSQAGAYGYEGFVLLHFLPFLKIEA
jgi:hypothetical protein